MKGSAAPNKERELLAALTKPGRETEEAIELGRRAEYIRSPMKVSHNSRMISMIDSQVVRRMGEEVIGEERNL
jgi:hypothetical protein